MQTTYKRTQKIPLHLDPVSAVAMLTYEALHSKEYLGCDPNRAYSGSKYHATQYSLLPGKHGQICNVR